MIPYKTQPMLHQAAELERSGDKPFWGILWQTGTGKTKLVLDNATHLFLQSKIDGLLVLSLTAVCAKWVRDEVPKHLSDEVPRRVVLWRTPSKKLERELATIGKAVPDQLHVLAMNIEALRHDRGYMAAQAFLQNHRTLLVIDEATLIKNIEALQTNRAVKLAKLAPYRRIMTGTPSTNSPLDVFAMFEFLQPGCLGHNNFFGFKNHYAVLRKRYINGRNFMEITGYQRLNDLREAVGQHSSRVLKADCLDLPPKVYDVRYVQLTDAQKKYYETLRDEALAILNSGTVVATPLAITLQMRLRQALVNLAPGENGAVERVDASNPRLTALLDILAEAGDQKVIIWSTFRESLADIHAALVAEYGAEAVGLVHGGIKPSIRHDILTVFQDVTSPLRYLVANQDTVGIGTDLFAASLVVYYNNDWSLLKRDQSEDRPHRKGQLGRVTYIDLVAPGTLDETVRESLVVLRDLAEAVTGDALRKLLQKPAAEAPE